MDRSGAPYGQYGERQANRVANQGAVMADAKYDIGARVAITMENSSAGTSMYDGAADAQVWNIEPHSLCFTVPGVQGSMGDSRLLVLSTLNGLGATASALYPNDPEAVRLAVKNQIQFVGINYQGLSGARGDVERGVAIQLGGLHTLSMGNGEYGADREDDPTIRPGDAVAWDVPEPSSNGRKGPGGKPRHGIPENKFLLQLRKASPRSSAQALLAHVLSVTSSPNEWRKAMGEHLSGTNAWHSAVKNVVHSYFTAISLAVGYLVKEDYVGGAGNLGHGTGDEVAVKLAQLLGVIPGASGKTAAARQLQFDLAKRIFHSPKDLASEFGTSKRGDGVLQSSSRSLAAGGFKVQNTDAGKLLLQQLNHFPRAVSSIDYAVLRNHGAIVGKATTGGSAQGSGNVHVYLGHHGS